MSSQRFFQDRKLSFPPPKKKNLETHSENVLVLTFFGLHINVLLLLEKILKQINKFSFKVLE
jgi:hypothetical protein